MFALLRKLSLTQWILISMVVGVLLGWAFPVEAFSGWITTIAPGQAAVTVATSPGQVRTFEAVESSSPLEQGWLGKDPRSGVKVLITLQRAGTRKVLQEGDSVRVEYQKFSARDVKVLSNIFLRMIKSLIAPLIFATLVIGIAGHGDDMRRVGRLALKSIIYFEIVTTLALVIGLLAVNLARPGEGVNLQSESAEQGQKFAKTQTTLGGVIEHIVPASVVEAAANNEVLQIVFWAILFAVAMTRLRDKPRQVLHDAFEALAEVMFKFIGLVMTYAPIGIGAAIAVTVSTSGLEVLWSLGKLVLTLYGALVVFLLVVLVPIALISRVPLKKFFSATKGPALIAFSTSSSEAALPSAMQNMETMGVPRRIVAFVMPTGYAFNLDGSTLYLAVAAIFAAQAAGKELSLETQIIMMLTLMLTSKGVAAVPRASLVILSGTLATFGLPLEAVAVILGVDALMDMARTTVNLIGNCLATCVMARWEGEFNQESGGTSQEPGETVPSPLAGKGQGGGAEGLGPDTTGATGGSSASADHSATAEQGRR